MKKLSDTGIYKEYNPDDFPTQIKYTLKCFDCEKWSFFYDYQLNKEPLKCPHCGGDFSYKISKGACEG